MLRIPSVRPLLALSSAAVCAVALSGCPAKPAASETASTATPASAATAAGSPVERGRYLVSIAGCNDCHTPKLMGPNGPEPDTARLLAGHPASPAAPPAPALAPGPWGAVFTLDSTAASGPWGTTYSANLTPDSETGLGYWNEQIFLEMVKTGKHMGSTRPVLPPMPITSLQAMTVDDQKAIFAYLQTIPAVKNRVPEPLPPAAPPAPTAPMAPAAPAAPASSR